jgi:hypothetical protein
MKPFMMKPLMRHRLPIDMRVLLVALGFSFGLATTQVQAQEKPAVEFAGSGFLTLGVGKMFGGTRGSVGGYDCPCFASDYAQAGVYDGRSGLQWKPDSKLGLQGVVSMDNQRYSLTAQAVSRGARDGKINLEWLYASARLNDTLTLQIGRKRLPMFYYSDTQDVGVTLPWTHLPPQLYGWEAVNYNGANLLIKQSIGSWSLTANVLAGAESIKDAGYDRIYNGRRSRTDAKWNKILGGDLTLQKDWFETRFVYIQSDTATRNVTGSWDAATGTFDPTTAATSFTTGQKQRIFGAAFNIDYEAWMARTEFIHIARPGQTFKDYASIVGGGRRFGKWQLMLTQSRYWGSAVVEAGGNPNALEAHQNRSVTLRYDLTTSSAIKAQLDFQRDQSGPGWGIARNGGATNGTDPPYGDARLLSVTYDMVF